MLVDIPGQVRYIQVGRVLFLLLKRNVGRDYRLSVAFLHLRDCFRHCVQRRK